MGVLLLRWLPLGALLRAANAARRGRRKKRELVAQDSAPRLPDTMHPA